MNRLVFEVFLFLVRKLGRFASSPGETRGFAVKEEQWLSLVMVAWSDPPGFCSRMGGGVQLSPSLQPSLNGKSSLGTPPTKGGG